MPTEHDYRLEPQDGPLSKVFCRHCNREIGEIYTAASTRTGTSTGRTEEQVDAELDELVREHLHHCEQQPVASPGSYVNELPNQSPEKGSMKHRR